jgi:superfamily I DNA and/or RNA helicase
MLVEQYRMNEKIMKWSSQSLYNNKLVAHPDVAGRLVDDLMTKEKLEEQIGTSDIVSQPLVIIDTAGSLMSEEMESRIPKVGGISESKHNNGEADLVIQTIIEL